MQNKEMKRKKEEEEEDLFNYSNSKVVCK